METRFHPPLGFIKICIATLVFYIGIFCFPKEAGTKIYYLAENNHSPEATNIPLSDDINQHLKIQTGNTSLFSSGTTTDIDKHLSATNTRLALLKKIQQQKLENPYQEKFVYLCQEKSYYCEIISFDTLDNYEKKFMYVSLASIIGDFISEHQQFGQPIFSVLKKIEILNKKGSPRAYATWSKIVLHENSIGEFKEYFNLIGHEIGHVMDLGAIQGQSREKDTLYTEFGKAKFAIDDPSLLYYKLSRVDEQTRREDMDQTNFCSRYGMSNPFEDFAECHNLYLNHNNMFLFMAKKNATMKKKYNFIANLYKGKYIFDDSKNINTLALNPDQRVWDTTKLIQ